MKVKALLTGLVLMSLVSGTALAQSVRFGVEGGLSLANLTGDLSGFSGSTLSSHVGMVGGFFLQLNVSPVFAIQPEILYSQEGTAIDIGGGSGNFDLSYVEVPVLLKLYIPGPNAKPNFFVGGALGFNALSQVSSGGASAPVSGVNSTEGSLIAGAGVDIEKFSLSGRYQLGLSNIGTKSVQNGAIALMVGYAFN